MRLRSPQFVFLFLLAFAGQVRQDHALRLVAGPSLYAGQLRELSGKTAGKRLELSCLFGYPAEEAGLTAKAVAVARIPWPMRHPALDSAAMMSYTGLLRA